MTYALCETKEQPECLVDVSSSHCPSLHMFIISFIHFFHGLCDLMSCGRNGGRENIVDIAIDSWRQKRYVGSTNGFEIDFFKDIYKVTTMEMKKVLWTPTHKYVRRFRSFAYVAIFYVYFEYLA